MSDAAGSEENNNMRIARGVGYPSPLGISNPRVLLDRGLAILILCLRRDMTCGGRLELHKQQRVAW